MNYTHYIRCVAGVHREAPHEADSAGRRGRPRLLLAVSTSHRLFSLEITGYTMKDYIRAAQAVRGGPGACRHSRADCRDCRALRVRVAESFTRRRSSGSSR
jgi:hypothetical protein